MCDYFSCKLDALVREDLSLVDEIYSEVKIKKVKAFKMAQYVMITPNPEDDVNAYLEEWEQKSGLLSFDKNAKRIGWDFPYVSSEQKNRFKLRGYAAAYILPEGFEPTCNGVEIVDQDEANYAMITIQEPFESEFERIPNAYKIIIDYLKTNGFKEKTEENILSCFEYVYEKGGITYMDVFIHIVL